MAVTREQIDNFCDFAVRQIEVHGEQTTIDELFDAWRAQYPTPDEVLENVAAVNASIHDFENGERGRPAGTLSRELRSKLDRGEA